MKVKILTPADRREFEAEAVFLPGALGSFEILPGHAAIISTLEKGSVRWRAAGKEDSYEIKSGVVRFLNDELTICAE